MFLKNNFPKSADLVGKFITVKNTMMTLSKVGRKFEK